METQFIDQEYSKRKRKGLEIISTIQKMLTVAFITIGIMSMTSIPVEAKSNIAGAKRITEKKIFSCKMPPKDVETTTLHLNLEHLDISRGWDDAGMTYEIVTIVDFNVYPNGKSKNSICKGNANWGEKNYTIPNVQPAWFHYNLDLELIIKNVPLNGRVELDLNMVEIDLGDNDYISFLRNDHSGQHIVAYPSKNIAYLTSFGHEFSDSMHLVNFGKSKRVVGTIVNSNEDTAGKLDFVIAVVTPKIKTDAMVGFCRNYALTAVDLNHRAQKYHCRGLFFMPPMWSNDHQKHYDWCMKDSNSKLAVKENNKRKNQLNECINKTADDYCHIYAQSAVDQFQHSQRPGCSVSGLGWSADKNAHFQWCVNTFKAGNISAIAAERAQRETMLSNCK